MCNEPVRVLAAWGRVRAAIAGLDSVLAECTTWDASYDERFIYEWRAFIAAMNDLQATTSLAINGRKPEWEDMYYGN